MHPSTSGGDGTPHSTACLGGGGDGTPHSTACLGGGARRSPIGGESHGVSDEMVILVRRPPSGHVS
jgi:hypothetical protein